MIIISLRLVGVSITTMRLKGDRTTHLYYFLPQSINLFI